VYSSKKNKIKKSIHNLITKWAKDMDRHFTEEDIKMVNTSKDTQHH